MKDRHALFIAYIKAMEHSTVEGAIIDTGLDSTKRD